MLTRKQLQISFFAFNIFTKIGFYPFAVDFKTGEIRIENSMTKWCIWWILLALTGFYALLVRIFFIFESHLEVPIGELTLVLCALVYWPAVYCFPSLFYKNLDLTVSSFNYLLQKPARRTTWDNMTLQEMFVLVVLPANIILVPVAHATVRALQPKAVYNFFSALPDSWQTRPVLITIVVAEGLLAVYIWSMVAFTAHSMVLFFHKCIEQVGHTLKIFERKSLKVHWLSAFGIRHALEDMRQLGISIGTYNLGYRHIHFIAKIVTLSLYILLTANGVLIFHSAHPLLAYTVLLFGNEFAMFYCLIFRKAFAIPMLTNQLKIKLRNFANSNTRGPTKKLYGAWIRSIPPTGIQVEIFICLSACPHRISSGLE